MPVDASMTMAAAAMTTAPVSCEALPRVTERPPVHVYTDVELARLLREARRVSTRHPFRGITLHAMIGLAAATGRRIGEVVRLDKGDVDFERGVLAILRTKFKKDRLVPIHPTIATIRRTAKLAYGRIIDLVGGNERVGEMSVGPSVS